ncbi:hypothetical protein HPP_1500 [Hydrangea phyllody phytoplasma]|uniref:ABC transporter domain-containing protein n=2 Tax=16SrI (Aster yellows group) TaxID=3042590 RepID=A0ABQ5PTL2_9MOLU|nr:hypothetical protein HPP_1500 [Hydrangea phyllody phytoplasma]GLH61407.1 hypothetical protein RHYP_3530 [Rhus yellows phytoplasma]GLH61742.1 hypothetical protein HP2P_1490 [Hydrangea phyllody phytoplasma]
MLLLFLKYYIISVFISISYEIKRRLIFNIKINHLFKKFQNTEVLENVSFQLPQKGLVFIIGKSGSGKSTLLNLIGGLDKPTKGNITVLG